MYPWFQTANDWTIFFVSWATLCVLHNGKGNKKKILPEQDEKSLSACRFAFSSGQPDGPEKIRSIWHESNSLSLWLKKSSGHSENVITRMRRFSPAIRRTAENTEVFWICWMVHLVQTILPGQQSFLKVHATPKPSHFSPASQLLAQCC